MESEDADEDLYDKGAIIDDEDDEDYKSDDDPGLKRLFDEDVLFGTVAVSGDVLAKEEEDDGVEEHLETLVREIMWFLEYTGA